MPVNWIGRVAIRDLSRRSSGDFQPIDAKSTSCSTSSPWPPSPGQEKGDLCCEGHPHIPRQGLRPCNPFLAFPDQTSSPVVDSSLARYYAHTEQVPLNLNTYDRRCFGRIVVEFQLAEIALVRLDGESNHEVSGAAYVISRRSCQEYASMGSRLLAFPTLRSGSR